MKKDSKKKYVNDIKIFLKKKKTTGEKVQDRYKNLTKEKKRKLCEYMKKYYLAHRK